jgi:iron complex outermembrane receptor protein
MPEMMQRNASPFRLKHVAVALATALGTSFALAQGSSGRALADLSLEELANIEITSVSRRAQRLGDAPTSVYVITSEDIRRSGATILPQALRLAPNLHVARGDARQFAINARGFNTTSSNKLLVLVDGRSVYTPLFSGVFWDAQDTLLEDVERIEVISGPGGTLWGTNAVNGVINVVTKNAAATQGGMVSAAGGNEDFVGATRYGGKLGADGHYRVWGKYFERDSTRRVSGQSALDAWDTARAGFRADWSRPGNQAMLRVDAYQGDYMLPGAPLANRSGASLLGRWNRRLDSGGELQLQGYLDRTERDQPGTFGETLDVADFELQHSLRQTGAHRIAWGASYRHSWDEVRNGPALAFLPANIGQKWTSVYAQDEIELSPALHLTAGARAEYNDYTGTELLPSLRLAWKPTVDRLVWTQASRAVRAPSRLDRDLFAPGTPPFVVLNGGPAFRSEVATVYELGYRAQASPHLWYSAALFHNVYDHLRTVEPRPGGAQIENRMEGNSTGIETWGSYQATRTWRLSAGLTALRERLRLKPDSRAAAGPSTEGNDPAHTWTLRSSHDLAGGHEVDLALRHVSALPNPTVPAYTALDLRWGWKVRRDLEVSIAGMNLLDRSHPEFGAPATRGEVPRSVLLKTVWRY